MSPSHTYFFIATWRTLVTGRTLLTIPLTRLLILLTIQYFLTLQFGLYFLQFVFFWITHLFFATIMNCFNSKYFPHTIHQLFFYLQITYFAYSTALTLLTQRYFTYFYSRGFLGLMSWNLRFHDFISVFVKLIPEKISAVWLVRDVILIFCIISLSL